MLLAFVLASSALSLPLAARSLAIPPIVRSLPSCHHTPDSQSHDSCGLLVVDSQGARVDIEGRTGRPEDEVVDENVVSGRNKCTDSPWPCVEYVDIRPDRSDAEFSRTTAPPPNAPISLSEGSSFVAAANAEDSDTARRTDDSAAKDSTKNDDEDKNDDLVPPRPKRSAVYVVLPIVLAFLLATIGASWAYTRHRDACVRILMIGVAYLHAFWAWSASKIRGAGRSGYESIDVDLESDNRSTSSPADASRAGSGKKPRISALAISLSKTRRKAKGLFGRPGEASLLRWASEDFALGSFGEDDDEDSAPEGNDAALMVNGASFSDGLREHGRTKWEQEEVHLSPSPRQASFPNPLGHHTRNYGTVG